MFHSSSVVSRQPPPAFHMLTYSTGPLQFTNGGETETCTVLPGETAEFEFSVLSYTSTISSCTLTRAVTTQNQDNTISCNSSRRWRTWCTVIVLIDSLCKTEYDMIAVIAKHTKMPERTLVLSWQHKSVCCLIGICSFQLVWFCSYLISVSPLAVRSVSDPPPTHTHTHTYLI